MNEMQTDRRENITIARGNVRIVVTVPVAGGQRWAGLLMLQSRFTGCSVR